MVFNRLTLFVAYLVRFALHILLYRVSSERPNRFYPILSHRLSTRRLRRRKAVTTHRRHHFQVEPSSCSRGNVLGMNTSEDSSRRPWKLTSSSSGCIDQKIIHATMRVVSTVGDKVNTLLVLLRLFLTVTCTSLRKEWHIWR